VDRVGGGFTPADLSHHRKYGSVYGGSNVILPIRLLMIASLTDQALIVKFQVGTSPIDPYVPKNHAVYLSDSVQYFHTPSVTRF
jgi:hypothetical protein